MKTERVHILVVDDVAENLQVLGNMLSKEGYNTSFAQDGNTAIEIATLALPDLILLDISMPEISGFEVCKILKQNPVTQHIPVIFISAHNQHTEVMAGFLMGAADFISKPFNIRELLARVYTHIQLKLQKDEISKLNTQLKHHNQKITDSIVYAKRIQNALLPSLKILSKKIPENFIIYKPKDIVSGDFFWFGEINNFLYLAVADCTGHGVPGAFMSILSISFLNQIIDEVKITNTIIPPNQILNKLRIKINSTLNSDIENTEIIDGLDISLILIDFNTYNMQFAGAGQSATIAPNTPDNKPLNDSSQLNTIHGDHTTIGYHLHKQSNFTNHQWQAKKHDTIYLWSDGYISQLGGLKDKTLGTKQLREIIAEISHLDLNVQQAFLLEKLRQWQGTKNQTDDILVIGLKIDF